MFQVWFCNGGNHSMLGIHLFSLFFLHLFMLAYFEWTPFSFLGDPPQTDIKSQRVFPVTRLHKGSTKVFSLMTL